MSQVASALRRAAEQDRFHHAGERRCYRGAAGERARLRADDIAQRLGTARHSDPDLVSLVVTAAHPGAGVSTVARALAASFAEAGGERVLLIDARFGRPSQHTFYRAAHGPGLRELAAGAITPRRALQSPPHGRLDLLTVGDRGRADLQAQDALREALSAYRTSHQWVIIDAPPVLGGAGTGALLALCDGAVLVAEAARSRLEALAEAQRILDAAHLRFVGTVLNRRRYPIPHFLYRLL